MRNQQAVQLLSELSRPGRQANDLARLRCRSLPPATGSHQPMADTPPALPEVAEPMMSGISRTFQPQHVGRYPHVPARGSCTMKYNPKRHERWAALPGFCASPPLQHESTLQGLLQLLFELQQMLGDISGLPPSRCKPAAGAQGELAALLVAAAYFAERQEPRTKVWSPIAPMAPIQPVPHGADCPP